MRVKSSNLYSIDHLGDDLYVSFNSDPSIWYKYYQVNQEVFDSIRSAPSIGQAFEVLIKRAKKPYPFTRIKMVVTGTDPNNGELIYSFPDQVPTYERKDMAMEEFDDVIKFLENKGLAKREMDEQGNPRVTFLGEYAKELAQYYKNKG